MKDPDAEDSSNINEDKEIAEEKLELHGDRVQTAEYSTQDIFTRSEVQHMIATEMEKSTSHCNAPVLPGMVEEKLIEPIQVRYDAKWLE